MFNWLRKLLRRDVDDDVQFIELEDVFKILKRLTFVGNITRMGLIKHKSWRYINLSSDLYAKEEAFQVITVEGEGESEGKNFHINILAVEKDNVSKIEEIVGRKFNIREGAKIVAFIEKIVW